MFILVFVQALLSGSCTKTDSNEEEVVALFDVTLASSVNGNGTAKYNSWQSSDRCLFYPLSSPSKAPASAPPLQTGNSYADFRVKLPSSSASGQVVLAYPSTYNYKFDGKLHYSLPQDQSAGVPNLLFGISDAGAASSKRSVTLNPAFGAISLVLNQKGVTLIELSALNNEPISGEVTADLATGEFEATASNVKIAYPSGRDFSNESVAIMLAPSALERGLSVKVESNSAAPVVVEFADIKEIKQGDIISLSMDGAPVNRPTELVFCGDNMIYMIRPEEGKDFESSVFWSFDVKTLASELKMNVSRCDHVDECKVVDGGTKLLATSSYGFAFLMDIATKKLIWCTNETPNAHSATLLPNGRVAVATSSGETANHNQILVYDVATSFKVVCRHPLNVGHGLVWDDAVKKLYASGSSDASENYGAIYTLSLQDWDTAVPSLKSEKVAYTSSKTNSIHDLQYVDQDRLVAACKGAWFYNVKTGVYTSIPHFASYAKIKSLNYNVATGQCWYTCADNRTPEPDKDTSTRQLCYTDNVNSTEIKKMIIIPQDAYKVRVINW